MSMDNNPIIVWFRRDLRISDNPALSEAVKTGQPVICLYIYEDEAPRPLGEASLLWLHHSLKSLSVDLKKIGAKLYLRKGRAGSILNDIRTKTQAGSIYWNRRYEEAARERDKALKTDLSAQRIEVKSFRANLLSEPLSLIHI